MNETAVVAVRGVIGFFTLLIFARLLGKQQIGQLNLFDYISGITIGSIASSLTTDLSTRVFPLWVGLATWTALVFGVQWATLKWRYASKYVDGEPAVVIMNGQVMEDVMNKLRYRASDLLEQLRGKGVFDLTEVEFAVLETNGALSVLKKSQHQPLTPKDMNISTDYRGMSTELIYDGVVVEQNLRQVHLDRGWLETNLSQRGVGDIRDVFLATLDTSGSLYVDTYRDHVASIVDISDYEGPS